MGLVHHDEVPVGLLQLRLEILAPRELIEPGDEQVALLEHVPGVRSLGQVARQEIERQAELPVQLVLPLLDERAGAHDEAPLEVASDHQLLDEEPRHDRLARAGVVGQHEPQRQPR